MSGVLKKIEALIFRMNGFTSLFGKTKSKMGLCIIIYNTKEGDIVNVAQVTDSRGKIIGRIDIEKRQKEAEDRKVVGHLEVDTIIDKNHKEANIILNDRASGMIRMGK